MARKKITPGFLYLQREQKALALKEKEALTFTKTHSEEFLKTFRGKISVDAIKAELCKRSFFYFFQQFIATIEPRPFIYAPHIKYLCNLAQKIFEDFQNGIPGKTYVINVPPSSSKSLILSVLFPAWCFAVDPSFKIISGSVTQDVSIELSTKVRTIMQHQKYRTYFPLTRLKSDESGKENFKTTLGGMKVATSVTSNTISRHACIILADDPSNTDTVKNKSKREQSNEWLYTTLSTRVVDILLSSKVLIQQRLHFFDNTAYILEKEPNAVHICLPGEIRRDKNGNWDYSKVKPAENIKLYTYDEKTDSLLLDPVRGSREALDKREAELGKYQYKVQVLQDPDNEEDSPVKREWFDIITLSEYADILKNSTQPRKTNFYVDTAFTDNPNGKNDPSVILAITTINNTMYVIKMFRKFLEFPDLVKQLKDFTEKNGYTHTSKVHIEPKGSGKSVYQYLKKQTTLNVHEYKVPMDDKPTRKAAASGSWEAKRVVLVEGAWNKDLLDEICSVHHKFWDVTDTLVMATENEIINKANSIITSDRFS